MTSRRGERARPGRNDYYMGIATAVRRRANCLGNRVGAIIVQDSRIVSTGYNGTPEGMTNCLDGGCSRCADRERYPSGSAYDICICVHAEQNALLAAARFGIAVQGGTVYSTLQPCFGCTKEMLQAGISRVFFIHDWTPPDPHSRAEYARLQARFPGGMHRLEIQDDDQEWALSSARATAELPLDETGHPPP